MPGEGSTQVQVANFSVRTGTGITKTAISIEVGGRGEVAELWGVHYSHFDLFPVTYVEGFAFHGLSTNPELLEAAPLAAMDHWDFAADHSIYGRYMWRHRAQGVGGTSALIDTSIIPLYGLVRPRRQVWVIVTISFDGIDAAMELYYRPIRLAQDDQDAIDRKYGKYRRS